MTDTDFAALWKATAKHLAREVREVDAVDAALRQAVMTIAGQRDQAKRAAVTLGQIVDRHVEDTLRWAGMEDQIGTNDPDQQLAWELCAEMPGKIAALTAERDRYRAEAESARKTGERILADALRYRAAIEETWDVIQRDVRALANLDPAELGGILARALNENGETS